MDHLNMILSCISTLEKIHVSGFDDADRYVGVIAALRKAAADLAKEDADG